jgi:hypothetical protein
MNINVDEEIDKKNARMANKTEHRKLMIVQQEPH